MFTVTNYTKTTVGYRLTVYVYNLKSVDCRLTHIIDKLAYVTLLFPFVDARIPFFSC